MTASDARTLVASYIPSSVADREGWAADIFSAMSVLDVALTPDNICAVVSVTEQESGFKADPPVPNLPSIAWAEIERRRAKAGIPKLVLDAALDVKSTNGRTYRERIDRAKTERDLSDVFEDMIGRVPFGRRFFEDSNPVRTGGPMQVSVAYAKAQVRSKPYPYPIAESIRDEVFTRRGGLYFGIAHLLDYPAPYDRYLYRYADFNAGHYASRNAAFQSAVAALSGLPIAFDGDVLPPGNGAPVGDTENAVRSLGPRLGFGDAQIRRDLEQGRSPDFSETALYKRVFEMADAKAGKAVPRAIVPRIQLQSAKFTRAFTTENFAQSVVQRHRACLARGGRVASAEWLTGQVSVD